MDLMAIRDNLYRHIIPVAIWYLGDKNSKGIWSRISDDRSSVNSKITRPQSSVTGFVVFLSYAVAIPRDF